MLLLTSIVLLTTIGCIWIGKILTEDPRFALPIRFTQLDRKPFNCRPCFTFHSIWIAHLLGAFVLHSSLFLKMGLLSAIVVYTILYIADKMKTIK